MEKLYTWGKSGNKMHFESGFKTFDKQSNAIGTGNYIANTQMSLYVRPYTEVTCNGLNFEEGRLRDYDLKYFELTNGEKSLVKKMTMNHQICLYSFFYYVGKTKTIIGHIIEQQDQIIIMPRTNKLKHNNCLHFLEDFIKSERGRNR